ncbi:MULTISPECIES: gamma carbonic anhydrase family protein [Pseudomonas]|uniref:Gamma carbonic anhydrase family protein n=1 Tax=Pseudomonas piscis TaxID=2614538 RepID=A0A7X1U884_9PSED|nr:MULTISPECIES: gamma carbonic anhydrase family protein [Pseudomonas]MQA57826.1 gamma carbonic anhydrase family protein [Pseudomonas piscis]POA57844.1 gamma carbonic anhydrase family protein [Pseudomonas sp. FW507-12TSA]WMN17878.1 gamma carbonic anhydrase family protein [Pseudomonas piscis]
MAIRTYQDHRPKLGERAFVDHSAVVIGDVEIGADSSVWPLTVIRGDMHRIRIGARTSVQDASVLHITHAGPFNPEGFPLLIGDDVTIAHKVMLHGCSIGSRVLIGMGSIVMDGAVVEDDVMVGAGSLVPPGKRLASGFLYVGSPVKQVRALTDKERAFFTYSAGNYVKLKDQHLAEGYDRP